MNYSTPSSASLPSPPVACLVNRTLTTSFKMTTKHSNGCSPEGSRPRARRSLMIDFSHSFTTPQKQCSPTKRFHHTKVKRTLTRPPILCRKDELEEYRTPLLVSSEEETKLLELPNLPDSPRGVTTVPRLERRSNAKLMPKDLFQVGKGKVNL